MSILPEPEYPPKYRTIEGEGYVLTSYALKMVIGASDDAIRTILIFIESYRPDDLELHNAIKSIFRAAKQ